MSGRLTRRFFYLHPKLLRNAFILPKRQVAFLASSIFKFFLSALTKTDLDEVSALQVVIFSPR